MAWRLFGAMLSTTMLTYSGSYRFSRCHGCTKVMGIISYCKYDINVSLKWGMLDCVIDWNNHHPVTCIAPPSERLPFNDSWHVSLLVDVLYFLHRSNALCCTATNNTMWHPAKFDWANALILNTFIWYDVPIPFMMKWFLSHPFRCHQQHLCSNHMTLAPSYSTH